MNVSIVVPSYNEEANIRECLYSLINLAYPLENYEIVVVDGNSKDKTQEIVKQFIKTYPNVSLHIQNNKGVAAARNIGINKAKYEYVAFIDADCKACVNWLSLLVDSYKKIREQDCIAVGGRNIIPKDSNNFLKAVGIVLNSYMGSFTSVQGRQLNSSTFVQSLSTANALYDKEIIMEVGCFDESLRSEAEDAELNYRLSCNGYKFLFIPDSFVWHKMRAQPLSWFKNMFRYGKGRGRLLKRYPKMWRIQYLFPIFFIIGIALTIFIRFSPIFFLGFLYFPFIFLFSLANCLKNRSLGLTLHVAVVYIMQHFGYSIGLLYGFINPMVK